MCIGLSKQLLRIIKFSKLHAVRVFCMILVDFLLCLHGFCFLTQQHRRQCSGQRVLWHLSYHHPIFYYPSRLRTLGRKDIQGELSQNPDAMVLHMVCSSKTLAGIWPPMQPCGQLGCGRGDEIVRRDECLSSESSHLALKGPG